MKRYMKFFTGIVFWGILLVCSACTDEYEANNGGMKECCEGVPFTVRAIVADFEELSNAWWKRKWCVQSYSLDSAGFQCQRREGRYSHFSL